MSLTAIFPSCPRCDGNIGNGRFCASCDVLNSYPDAGAYKASRWRRLGGALLDGLIIAFTFGIGWLIWLAFTAPDGQTPAKKLLDMYILKETGEPVTAGQVWIRDVLIEIIVLNLIGIFILWIATLIDAAWIFLDPNHQTIHDKMVKTIVVYAPREQVPSDNPYQSGFAASTGPNIPSQSTTAGRPGTPPAAPPAAKPDRSPESREDRLRELQSLAEQGFITADEHAERRRRIIDDI